MATEPDADPAAADPSEGMFPFEHADAAAPTIALPVEATPEFDEDLTEIDLAREVEPVEGEASAALDAPVLAEDDPGDDAWDHFLRPPFAIRKRDWANYADKVRNGSSEGDDT